MRRLDELLSAASDRGHRTGPDVLIEHLERRLAGEREQVVAAPLRRTDMATTIERPIPTESPPPPRKRWALAMAAFAIAVVAVAVAVVMLGEDDVAERDPVDIVADFGENIRTGDLQALTAGAPAGDTDASFVEWMIGLEANPRFTDCNVTYQSPNGSDVRCSVVYDPDSFFVRTLGEQELTFVARTTPDGLMTVLGWPPPPGLSQVAAEMQAWIQVAHPQLEDRMFGIGQGYAGLIFSRDAGELIHEHLDEFIAYRENPPTSGPRTPTQVLERLATALESADSQIDSRIVPNPDDVIANEGFLAWNIGLGIDPEFTNCREQAAFEGGSSQFLCDVTMGEAYFFSVVAGENLSTSVTTTVQRDGSLAVTAWPDPDGLTGDAIEFREWIRATHPQLEERMFGDDYAGVLRFTSEAGELHTQYLEEYLEYLTSS